MDLGEFPDVSGRKVSATRDQWLTSDQPYFDELWQRRPKSKKTTKSPTAVGNENRSTKLKKMSARQGQRYAGLFQTMIITIIRVIKLQGLSDCWILSRLTNGRGHETRFHVLSHWQGPHGADWLMSKSPELLALDSKIKIENLALWRGKVTRARRDVKWSECFSRIYFGLRIQSLIDDEANFMGGRRLGTHQDFIQGAHPRTKSNLQHNKTQTNGCSSCESSLSTNE